MNGDSGQSQYLIKGLLRGVYRDSSDQVIVIIGNDAIG